MNRTQIKNKEIILSINANEKHRCKECSEEHFLLPNEICVRYGEDIDKKYWAEVDNFNMSYWRAYEHNQP